MLPIVLWRYCQRYIAVLLKDRVKLKIPHHFYRNCLILLASLLLGLFLIRWFKYEDVELYLLFLSASSLLYSYRFTKSYATKNSLFNLIKRKADLLEISRIKTSPFSSKSPQVSLAVHRISTVTIGNNWLSIIIDGNGNGYDFQLVGSKEVIVDYLNSQFDENELSNIDFKCL